jgi:hypothetical protein
MHEGAIDPWATTSRGSFPLPRMRKGADSLAPSEHKADDLFTTRRASPPPSSGRLHLGSAAEGRFTHPMKPQCDSI